jgi:hypothetical protein
MSKSHPHMSPEFLKKQATRKARGPQRELLASAKEIYRQRFGDVSEYHRGKLN